MFTSNITFSLLNINSLSDPQLQSFDKLPSSMTSILEPYSDELARGHDPIAITSSFPPLDFTNLLTFDNGLQPTSSPHCGFIASPFSSARRYNNPLSSPSVVTESLFSTISPFAPDTSAVFQTSSAKQSLFAPKSFQNDNISSTINQTRSFGEQYPCDSKSHQQNIQSDVQEVSSMTGARDMVSQHLFIGNDMIASNNSLINSIPEEQTGLYGQNNSQSTSTFDNNNTQEIEIGRESKNYPKSPEDYVLNEKSSASDKMTKVSSTIDKAAERRRKNRESSSRCYYNRKRIIENLEKQISAEKAKLTDLYDRALELRHSNAKLKRDVVTRGLNLPVRQMNHVTDDNPNLMQLTGYLNFMKSSYYRTVI